MAFRTVRVGVHVRAARQADACETGQVRGHRLWVDRGDYDGSGPGGRKGADVAGAEHDLLPPGVGVGDLLARFGAADLGGREADERAHGRDTAPSD